MEPAADLKAIVVHSLAEAEAALRASAAAGRPVLLVSPPGAVGYGGAPWFLALVEAARVRVPAAEAVPLLDCGDSLADALQALESGVTALAFAGGPEASGRFRALAAACGVSQLSLPEERLELAGLPDPEAACRAFLGA